MTDIDVEASLKHLKELSTFLHKEAKDIMMQECTSSCMTFIIRSILKQSSGDEALHEKMIATIADMYHNILKDYAYSKKSCLQVNCVVNFAQRYPQIAYRFADEIAKVATLGNAVKPFRSQKALDLIDVLIQRKPKEDAPEYAAFVEFKAAFRAAAESHLSTTEKKKRPIMKLARRIVSRLD